MSILDARDITEAERAAIDDEPRPGVWLYSIALERLGGDGRAFSQDDTDAAIEHELLLLRTHGRAGRIGIASVLPRFRRPRIEVLRADGSGVNVVTTASMITQRGGIHSDPLVRLLAFRTWGDRDRAWRKRDAETG